MCDRKSFHANKEHKIYGIFLARFYLRANINNNSCDLYLNAGAKRKNN